ncbi:hypothetical protein FQA39_LY00454 [Lamprigera yunnana]|nr:hypothetical protein FQA39_LY00454 [Lamprigera yunnana]
MEEIKEMLAQIQEKLSRVEEKLDKNTEQQDERIALIEGEIRKNKVIIKEVEDKEEEKPEEGKEKVRRIFEKMGLGRIRDEEVTEKPPSQYDRYDLIGKSFALRIRALEKRQRLIVEKKINYILFEVEMGMINTPTNSYNLDYQISSSSTIPSPSPNANSYDFNSHQARDAGLGTQEANYLSEFSDYYLCSHMEVLVNRTLSETLEDLSRVILEAAELIRNNNIILRWATSFLLRSAIMCLESNGGYFEQNLK